MCNVAMAIDLPDIMYILHNYPLWSLDYTVVTVALKLYDDIR